MNIIYGNVSRDFYEMVIRKLMKEMDVDKQIAITEMYRGSKDIFFKTYEFSDVYYGRYEKFEEYYQCLPADEEVIKKTQNYAMEALKMMDRPQSWGFSFEERMQLFYKHVTFWNSVIDMYKINCAIFFNVPHEVFDYVIYFLCKIKNIRTFVLFTPPIYLDRAIISTDFLNENTKFADYLCDYNMDCASEYGLQTYKKYNNLMNNEEEYRNRSWNGGGVFDENLKTITWLKIRNIAERKHKGKIDTLKTINDISIAYSMPVYRWFRDINSMVQKAKTKAFLSYYERKAQKPILGEKYIYFSLHYQPEATSEPWGGGMFSNQLIPIKMISKHLPKGYMLYVKEHPSQTYVGKARTLYDEICKIDNVRLISLKIDSNTLISNAIANATLTGTVCMESVLKGIPCITFGKYLYNSMEGALPVRTNNECKEAIERICSNKIIINKFNVKKYFCALFDYSKKINIGYGLHNYVRSASVMSEELIKAIKNDK